MRNAICSCTAAVPQLDLRSEPRSPNRAAGSDLQKFQPLILDVTPVSSLLRPLCRQMPILRYKADFASSRAAFEASANGLHTDAAWSRSSGCRHASERMVSLPRQRWRRASRATVGGPRAPVARSRIALAVIRYQTVSTGVRVTPTFRRFISPPFVATLPLNGCTAGCSDFTLSRKTKHALEGCCWNPVGLRAALAGAALS